MPLNAGELDRRIAIQARAAGKDARGQPDGAWATVAKMWARPMPKSGREFFAASQMQAELGMMWRVRYRTDVSETMRIVELDASDDETTTAWEIAGPPVPSANREWLDLYCLQGVRDGR
jgi:SPP1 family predicted phage head-tail adaptor